MSHPAEGLGATSGWSIENRFFTEQRLLVYGSTAAVSYAIALAWRLFHHEWYFGSGKEGCIDFTVMWVSGFFAGTSDPAGMYDASAWSAAWNGLTGLEGCVAAQGHISYPPTFLFLTYPLSLMPYSIGFVLWMIATLLPYLVSVYIIVPRLAAVIAALTPLPVIVNVLQGHNGFLTAGLIGLSLVVMERQQLLSGIFLGLLTYKPQFGILFPFALLASRNLRTFISATATSVTFGVAAAIAFGSQGWLSFIYSLIGRQSNLIENPKFLVSIFGSLLLSGNSAAMSWAVHLAVAVIVAAGVCAVWAKPIPHSLKAATLCVGSVVVTPYALAYDLCILSIAVAFLVKDGLSRGFLRGERAVMFICWLGLYLFLLSGASPAIIYFLLLALVVRRIVLHRRKSLAPLLPLLQAQGPQ